MATNSATSQLLPCQSAHTSSTTIQNASSLAIHDNTTSVIYDEPIISENEKSVTDTSTMTSTDTVTNSDSCVPGTDISMTNHDNYTTQNDTPTVNDTEVTPDGVVEVISSTCWYLPGVMNGVKTDLLVDSGSTYTIMDYDLYMSIPEAERPELQKIQLVLRSATGDKLQIHGHVAMHITLGEHTYKSMVKIVTLGDKSTILGLDFMEEHACTVNMGKGLLQVGNKLPCLKLHRQTANKCARVQVAQNICIPPHHEMIIKGRINQRHRSFDEPVGEIESTLSLPDVKNLLVAKAVVRTDKNCIPVKVANFTPNTIQLDAGYTVALLHPVDEDSLEVIKTSTNLTPDGFDPSADLPEHLQPLLDGIYSEATQAEKAMVKRVLLEYQDCFMAPGGKLGHTDLVQHEIIVGDARPQRQKLRLPPMHLQKAVDDQLDKMLEAGIIEPCQSPWACNLVVVPKKDNTVRLCADLRYINSCLINHSQYPLPKIEECLNTLSGSSFYCTMDLCQGYHQVEVHPRDRDKVSIITRKGQFRYRVMPFGLSNSPSSFEHLMEVVLRNLQWEKCVVYLDDVVCFGKDFDSTLQNLQEVLQRFRQANLVLKPSKCKFMVKSVAYLGHIISERGIEADGSKIEAVKTWSRPENVKEVRSFTGFCSYYRRHLKDFSEVAAPLFALTRKRVKFDWSESCEKAFTTLKELLISAPCLAYPDRSKPFILDVDASLNSIGGVLSQIDDDGLERPIAYASKVLSKTQRNYCCTMRELLSCVVFLRHFHHYVYGKVITLRTDHSSLTWLTNLKESSGMLARWLTTLGMYQYKLVHRKGVLHQNSDSLSRLPIRGRRKCKRDDCDDCALKLEDCVCVVTRSQTKNPANTTSPDSNHSNTRSGQDDIMNPTLTDDQSINPVEGNSSQTADPNSVNTQTYSAQNDSTNDNNLNQSAEPNTTYRQPLPANWVDTWSKDEVHAYQLQDPILKEIINLLENKSDAPDKTQYSQADNHTRALYNQWQHLELHDGLLYRKWVPENPDEQTQLQMVVPDSLRKEILHLLHTHKTGGHAGVSRIIKNCRQRFYWPGHKSDIERYCAECKICQSLHNNIKRAPLQQKPVYQRFEKICIDICGPYEMTRNLNRYILVVGDSVSKWSEAYPIPDQSARVVADVLSSQFFTRYGVATTIHSDLGKSFENQLFKELCDIWDIHKTRTSRYRPCSNGQIESFNRLLKKMLRCFAHDFPNSWEDYLPYLMMAYRATPHSSTNCSPNSLTFGEELRLPIDLLYAQTTLKATQPECPHELAEWIREAIRKSFRVAHEHLKKSAKRIKKNYDRNTFLRKFEVGQWVWVLNPPEQRQKLGRAWQQPFLVVKQLTPVNYVVQLHPNARKITLHVDHMKAYINDDAPESWLPTNQYNKGTQ